MSNDPRREPTPALRPFLAQTLPNFSAKPPWVDLHLDGNEGMTTDEDVLMCWQNLHPEFIRRYPSRAALETEIARRHSLPTGRVFVSAGLDEGLDRFCRAVGAPGRNFVLPEPTFEMLPTYAALSGADVRSVPWLCGTYPLDRVLAEVDESTCAVFFVSPNNPTGLSGTAEELETLLTQVPHAWVFVDLAYAEFDDRDLSALALRFPQAVIGRTLSKAWGLAGLRIGYMLGDPDLVRWMRLTGSPFTVSGPAAALAAQMISKPRRGVQEFAARVCCERRELTNHLRRFGVEVWDSRANFVLARFRSALWIKEAMSSLGIAVRNLSHRQHLENCVRITCPGDDSAFSRLRHGLATVLSPTDFVVELDTLPREFLPSAAPQTGMPRLVFASSHGVRETRESLRASGLESLASQLIFLPGSPETTGAVSRAGLGLDRAWFITGDPRRLNWARSLGFVGLGVAEPDNSTRRAALEAAGAARIFSSCDEVSRFYETTSC